MMAGGQESRQPGTPGRARTPAPLSVARAVVVMYGGAALSVVGIFVNITTLGVIRQRMGLMSPALLASTQHQAVAEFIVGGLVTAAVWAFIGISCRAGMEWARIAGTVLFVVNTVFGVDVILGLDGQDAPAAVRIYAAAVWLAGLAATMLLWQRESGAYFRSGRRPRP
ncbi:MAG: hypothetical protein ACRDN0_14280 [Trebonia sp.]